MKKHILPLAMISLGAVGYFLFSFAKIVDSPFGMEPVDIMRICVMLAFCALAFVLYYMMRIKKEPLYKSYFVTGVVFGLIFMFIIPPYSTPDELVHIWSAYNVSNDVLGYPEVSEEGMTLVVRACERDAELNQVLSPYMSRDIYNNMLTNIFELADEAENVLVDSREGYSTPKLMHIIPAIGVTIGRLLSWNVVPTLLLGTLFNMLFFVGSSAYAIKKVPFGKAIIACFCLIPMTLQQASSYSYDNPLLAASIVVIALGIKWCFSDEKIETSEIVVYIIYSMFLIAGKSSVYAAFCLLPVMYKFSKERIINIWKNYKTPIIIFIIIAAVLLLGDAIIGIITSIGAPSVELSAAEVASDAPVYENYIAWADAEGFTLKYLLTHPVLFVKIIVNTLLYQMDYLIMTLYGQTLGWFQIGMSTWVILLYGVIGLLSTVKTAGEISAFTAKDRIAVSFVSLISCAMCAMGMLLFWTPRSYTMIEGLQGRYFLPPYLALLFMLRNDNLVVNKNIDNKLLFASVCAGACAVYFLMSAVQI